MRSLSVRLLLALSLVTFAVSLVFAHLNGPPPGHTGAPGEGTCADVGCHDDATAISGGVSAGGGLVGFDTLICDVFLNGGGGVVKDWGFQVTISNSTNEPYGQIITTDSVRTQIVEDTGGRQYLMHTAAGSHYDQCSCVDYPFRWIRTSGVHEPEWITFNVAGVFANGDGTRFGDAVIIDTVSVRLCPIRLAGDVNSNSVVTSSDIIWMVGYTFKGGPAPNPCAANGDVNCTGDVTSADIIYLVNYVFKGGTPPCDICPLIYAGTWACST